MAKVSVNMAMNPFPMKGYVAYWWWFINRQRSDFMTVKTAAKFMFSCSVLVGLENVLTRSWLVNTRSKQSVWNL